MSDRLDPLQSFLPLRARSADETYRCVLPYLAELGITRVASQTGLDRIGIPVWCAFVPNAKAIVIAQGKGLTHDQARTSAIMEAVERVIATSPSVQTRLASAGVLESQGSRFHRLDSLLSRHAEPLGPDEAIAWVEGVNLFDGGSIWLPFDAVEFDRTRLSPRFWQSSDGLASGNTREEAILHGLLERIERDALALWSVTPRGSQFARRIDPKAAGSDLDAVLARLSEAELQIALFDVTTDLQIPVVVALLAPIGAGDTTRFVDLTLGAGAALAPEAAVLRATLEAIQSRMTFIAGSRDDVMPGVFQRAVDPHHLAAFHTPHSLRVSDMSGLEALTARDALDVVLARLADRGVLNVFAAELGPQGWPIHVVKVVAPDLEHPDGARRVRFGQRALSRSLR